MLLPDPRFINELYARYVTNPTRGLNDAIFKVRTLRRAQGRIYISSQTYEFKKPLFNYYMVPIKDTGTILRPDPALRPHDLPDQLPTLSSHTGQHVMHSYPYLGIGPLELHIQPHYAIVNAAEKWAKLHPQPKDEPAVQERLSQLREEFINNLLLVLQTI
jgi:hypothetical protein